MSFLGRRPGYFVRVCDSSCTPFLKELVVWTALHDGGMTRLVQLSAFLVQSIHKRMWMCDSEYVDAAGKDGGFTKKRSVNLSRLAEIGLPGVSKARLSPMGNQGEGE